MGFDPSRLLVQISMLPLRSDMNTNFLPSGENCAPTFVPAVEETKTLAACVFLEVGSTSQMFSGFVTF